MTLKRSLIIASAFVLLGAGCASTAPADEVKEVSDGEADSIIIFDGSKYSPRNVTIGASETVTFRNESDKPFWPASFVHPVHNILPEFDALKPIPAGSDYSFTFTKAGKWRWHDHIRPSLTGTITVIE